MHAACMSDAVAARGRYAAWCPYRAACVKYIVHSTIPDLARRREQDDVMITISGNEFNRLFALVYARVQWHSRYVIVT